MSQRMTGSDVAQGLLRLSPSEPEGTENSYYPLGSQKVFRAVAGTLFAALLCLLLYFTGHLRITDETEHTDLAFKDVAVVRGPGSFLQIPHTPVLNPSQEDLLLLTWVRPRALPPQGERQIFLLKYDAEKHSRTGFGLALSRRGDEVRPEVYWRDSEGKGGWYQYTSLAIQPEEWSLFALSFRKGRLLGLHGAVVGDQASAPEFQLLGGYDVGEVAPPAPVSDLFVGAPSESTFRGRIGMVALLRGEELTEELRPILAEALRSPGELDLSLFPKVKSDLFITGGKRDHSPHGHTVNLIRVKSQ